MIDRLVRGIPDAESDFTILFSGEPFPGQQVEFQLRGEEMRGNRYYIADMDLESRHR